MTRVRSVPFLAVMVLITIGLVALACGGEEQEVTAPTVPSEATPTAVRLPASPTAIAPKATATVPAASPTPAGPTSQTLDIAMVPTLKFDKSELGARAGAEVTVRFDNRDTGIPHNWAVYTDNSASKGIAGANEQICTGPCTGQVRFGPLAAGAYFFRCDVHPTQMTGQFIVE